MQHRFLTGARLRRMVAALTLAGVAWGVFVPLAAFAQAGGGAWSKDLGATLYSVAASVDGGTVLVGRRDNVAIAFDSTGEELWQATTNGSVYGVALSDDGKWAATASEGRRVLLLDENGHQVWEQSGSQTFTSVAITKDGGIVAAGSDDRNVYVFDRAGTLSWNYAAPDAVTSVAVYGSEGGFRVLAGTRDSRVTLLSGQGDMLWQARLRYPIGAVAVTPDGRHIAAGDREGNVYLLDGVSGSQQWDFDAGSRVQGVGISSDGQRIAAGTAAGELVVLRPDGTPLQRQPVGGAINALALTHGNADLVVAMDTAVTFAGGGGDTYIIARPPSRIVPIVVGTVAAIVIVAAVASIIPFRGERGWQIARRKGRTTGRQIWRARVSYLFLVPTLLLLAVFNYYPAFSGIAHAFTVWKPGVSTEWVGLQNFRALVADRYLWIGTGNAVILIVTGFLKLLLPLLVAELIFHLRNDFMRYIFRTLFVLPLIVPGVVGILLWVNIYDPNIGLANQTLRSLGLESWTRVWLGDAGTALWAIVFMGFPWISAFALLIFYGGLISIPSELFDAAEVDGASGLRTFWSIHLPLLLGQIRLLLILGFIAGVQEFSAVYLTTGGGPGSSTYLPALELYYQAVRFNNFGLASAIGAVLFLIIMAGTIINLRYVRSSVEYSA